MNTFLSFFEGLDPGPLFVLSLFPYLVFLYWAKKSDLIPRISLWGFSLTLAFVAITIIFSIYAQLNYGKELTDVDFLHGSAEAFLALSDGLVVLGFAGLLSETGK